APLPGARLRRDGAAGLARREGARRREGEGVPRAAAARPGARRPWPVRRLPRRGRRAPRLGYGDVRRARGADRQLALGRRAVLPAHGQAARAGPPRHHDRLQGAAAPDVRRRRLRAEQARVRGRGARRHLGRLPREGPRTDHAARQRADGVRLRGLVLCGEPARGVRAADPRRADRRPHALHALGRDRAPVGGGRAAARLAAAGAAVRARVVGPRRRPRPDRPPQVAPPRVNSTKEQTVIDAILFDIDGTLITTGGAGAAAWRMAFEDLHGIPADIGMFSDAGMTDPAVGRRTFVAVLDREPTPRELATLLAGRLAHLPGAVYESPRYRVLPGVDELLPKLADDGYLLGLTTGGTDSAA